MIVASPIHTFLRRLFAARQTDGSVFFWAILVIFAVAPVSRAEETVVLQLKWYHQFQFAGYYAAVEKGFYRDNGLDVAVREGGPGMMRASRWPRALPTSACPRPVFSSTATNAPTMSSSA